MNGLIAPAILITIVGTLLFFYALHHKDEAMADDESLNDSIQIIVHGYWLDDGEPFSYPAVIGKSDGIHFAQFNSREEIIGTHNIIEANNTQFHIHSYEEINHD